MTKDAIVSALKEAARLAVLAAISAAVSYLLQFFGAQDQTNVVVLAGTLALRTVDKYIHEDQSIKANGLLPF